MEDNRNTKVIYIRLFFFPLEVTGSIKPHSEQDITFSQYTYICNYQRDLMNTKEKMKEIMAITKETVDLSNFSLMSGR